jgi:hypothetical protein
MSRQLTQRMRGRWLALTVGMGAVVALSCTDISSAPNTPFSIEFNRAPSPSVVLGDTLFDSLGVPTPLRAIVFNAQGDTIHGAAVTYHVVSYDSVLPTDPAFRDSVPLTVDPTTGVVTGKSGSMFAGDTARVYAQAGKIQSNTVTIMATRNPGLLAGVVPVVDSFTLSFITLDTLHLSTPFSVRLTAGDTAVPRYLVRFRIVQPATAVNDTSYVMLTNGDRRRSELDTTDATGVASRIIRIRRANFPFGKAADAAGVIRDTIRVRASAYRLHGTLVPARDSEFIFIVKANKP